MERVQVPAGELERLKHRIAKLERGAAEHHRTRKHLEDRFHLLASVTREAVVVTHEGTIVDISPEFEALLGYPRDELVGKRPVDLVAPESREITRAYMQSGSTELYESIGMHRTGRKFLVEVRGRTREYMGRTVRVATLLDVTDQRRAQQAADAATVQAAVIQAQAEMLAQLSTPLLPISDQIVVLPLIGEVNPARAAKVVETLTHGVFSHRARVAILDITGLRAVDAPVADMLVRAAEAVQLLGARAILTGIRPEVAQALVQLGRDLGAVVTLGTLQQGVAYALRQTMI